MKLNQIIFLSIFTLIGISCTKKLDKIIIENKEIKLEKYKISEITTIHSFVDITNKRWNKTERIFEGNTEVIDSLFIRNDSIIITTKYDEPVIYDLAALKFGYTIAVIKTENDN